jgi:hypothetical protein
LSHSVGGTISGNATCHRARRTTEGPTRPVRLPGTAPEPYAGLRRTLACDARSSAEADVGRPRSWTPDSAQITRSVAGQGATLAISLPSISAGVRASSSMSVDHVRGHRRCLPVAVGSRARGVGQPRCPRRPSAGPASLRWDMNYPPTNKWRCSIPIHAIGLSTTTARASALVPDPYRVRAACPQRVRWSQCGQSTDRHSSHSA